MKLTWLKNGFICKELYAPFKISKDIDYRNDLEKKYNIVMEQAQKANADDESLRIINVFSTKILESLDLYYKVDIAESNNIIFELVRDIGSNPFAVNSVINSDAFNYSLYKQLNTSLKYKEYELRSTYTGYITNIGSFERQYPYRETDFYNFDKFLFTTWRDKPNGKGKDVIPWGIKI